MTDTVNPHGGVHADLFPPAPHQRKPLGPGYDWIIELARQAYRPLIGLICAIALADQLLFAAWYRGGEGRLDAAGLGILAGLVAALAGLRGWELSRYAGQ